MRTPRPISEEQVAELKHLMHKPCTVAEYKRMQCIWLRATLNLTPEKIAVAVDLKPSTVRQIQSRYLRNGVATLLGPGRGGRRHEYLTHEEERAFIEQFRHEAESGNVLEVSDIKRALETKVGHPVHKTTVYRMLDRHGWRKIIPRPRHPKGDRDAQEAFKKTSTRSSRTG